MATTWLIRKTGADTNGGTSATVRSTGTDGIASSVAGTTKFTSISAAWTSADIGHGIYASSGTILRLISAVQVQQTATGTTNGSTTHVTSSAAFNATMLGCAVSGPGIAAGTIVVAYNNSSDISLSIQPSGGVGTGTITFGPLLTTTGTTAFTAATGQTWNVGGAILTFARAMVAATGVHNAYSAGDSIYVGAGTYRETVANTLSGAVTASGTNGVTSTNGTTFTDSTASAFTAGMVGKNIEIIAGGSVFLCLISGYTSSSVVTIAPATAMGFPTTAYSSCTWQVGKVAIVADVDGANTGDAGQVTLSAYTTNDTSAPSATTELTLAATHDLSFALFTVVGSAGGTVTNAAPTTALNISFLDCAFNMVFNASAAINFFTTTTGLAMNVEFDRCTFLANNTYALHIRLTTLSSGADYDVNFNIRNSLIINQASSGQAVSVFALNANTYHGGGVRMYNCTILAYLALATAANVSTTIPCEVHNCLIVGGAYGIDATTAGQITGSYNVIYAPTPEVNYTYGTGDVSNSAGTGTYKAPLVELGQSWKWAGVIRQFLAPDGATSPLLGAGSATFTGNYPTVDWANRPRPSGGGSARASVGYSELHDFSVQDTVTYPTGQTSSASMTGPGDTDIWVPVDAVSTTIAIQLYQNAGYTGTTYATATIEAQGELGVVTQTQTCSSTTGSWQTLTFSAISASKAGWVKVRISSFDTSGTGVLYFGALTAT